MFRTSRFVAATIAACLMLGTPMWSATQEPKQTKENSEEVELVQKSMEVLRDLTKVPEDGIPRELLARAEGIVVIPSLVKGGFIVGGKHGKGLISAKSASGEWSAPAVVKMTGGSIGWQIGVESVDLVLLVMNKKGIDQMLQDKFQIGGDLSVAAGPVGRNAAAATNAQANAGLLAYSRAKGLFAGATLEGSALHADGDDNEALYGREIGVKEIVQDSAPNAKAPAIVGTWRSTMKSLAGK
jgi:lipid-binding SYLF domain-containing protein